MYTQHHQDALELEVTVLSRLLQRNQCSHRRSKPFQHASMALRCLLLRGSAGALTSNQDDRESPPSEHTPYLQLFASSKELLRRAEAAVHRRRAKRKRQQVFWELSSSEGDNDEVHEIQELRRRHDGLVRALNVPQMKELFSRFDSAAAYLLGEIARGFFLPFMTVAIAALARIRILSLQLFVHVTDAVLPQSAGYLRELSLEEDATDTSSQRSIEDARAFLSTQAGIHHSDTPRADDPNTNTRSSKERKRIREDARRRRFLRDLGLPARMAVPIVDDAVARSEPMDATSQPDEVVPDTSRLNDDDDDKDSTDSVIDALPATRRDRGSPEAHIDRSADNEIDGPNPTSEVIDLLDAGASNVGEDDTPRSPSLAADRPPEDYGESVAVVAAAVPVPATGFGRPPPPPAHPDDGILDKNLAWTERLGREKKKSKTKATTTKPSKKRKQEKGRGAPTLPSTRQDGEGTGSLASQVKRSKPTKKPKERHGGDFFDDLFG